MLIFVHYKLCLFESMQLYKENGVYNLLGAAIFAKMDQRWIVCSQFSCVFKENLRIFKKC